MSASIREISNINTWLEEWTSYEEKLKKIKENEHAKVVSLMDEYNGAQEKLMKNVAMQKKNLQAFTTSFQRIKQSGCENQELLEMSNKLNSVTESFDEFDKVLPRTAGWFLKACIGEINVSLFQKKHHYKDVYEKFKLKTMIIAMIYSLLNLMVIQTRFTDAVFNGLLVWYYSSLTLQEQILRANGSRIKGWYVAHHYFSILLSGFLLIWPASASYQEFRTQFYCFVLYLSLLQCIQYYYQSGILYRKRALGHAHEMDTTQAGVRTWLHAEQSTKLQLLVPFLIGGYLFQFANAYKCFLISRQESCHEWQVLASAVLFAFIATGNVITLYVVLMRKRKSLLVRTPCF